jgi:hypothetical protein
MTPLTLRLSHQKTVGGRPYLALWRKSVRVVVAGEVLGRRAFEGVSVPKTQRHFSAKSWRLGQMRAPQAPKQWLADTGGSVFHVERRQKKWRKGIKLEGLGSATR